MIEILVVLSIIVVLGLAAVPAMRFITGARSTDSATNMASAMLGRARSAAILDQQHRGVFFFFDPIADRTTMAMVKQEGDKTPDPDFDAYKGWTDGKTGNGINYQDPPTRTNGAVQYFDDTNANGPSFAVALNAPGFASGESYGNFQKPILKKYKCVKSNAPTAANEAASTGGVPTYWNISSAVFLEILDYSDFQTLPPGVGLQLINDTHGQANTDRYLRTGVILFDGNGRFDSVPYGIRQNSKLAAAIGLSKDLNPDLANNTGAARLYSQFGIVLYDRQMFISTAPGTENDFIFSSYLSTPPPASFAAESTEESWLDNTSTPLMINRSNGTLIKGE